MPEVAAPTQTKSPYDLQRERIDAQARLQEEAKKKAVERQLSNKGIADSGIALGQTRRVEQDVRLGAAAEKNQVNINEGLAEESKREAALNRALQEKQFSQSDETARRGQDISKELGLGGLKLQERGVTLSEKSQADSLELAKQGLGMDQARLALQERGMNQQDAQYYAGLGQAKYLAERGLSLEEIRTQLQEKGMSQQDAQYYAGLTQQAALSDRQNTQFYAGLNQAKELALAGLDIQRTAQELQAKGMDQQQAQFQASLAQADRHAQQGFTLQESAQDLQRQGLDQQNAQFYAGLAQSNDLAKRGFDLQASAQELQRQGMDQQQAQFYAGLSQAKYLAEQGLARDMVAVKLQERGMDAQQAQFQANLAFNYDQLAQQKDLTQSGITADIQKGILLEQMAKIPVDEFYNAKMNNLLAQFGLSDEVYAGTGGASQATSYGPSNLPANTPQPNSGKWSYNTTAGGVPMTMYWNPESKSYQTSPNAKYQSMYG